MSERMKSRESVQVSRRLEFLRLLNLTFKIFHSNFSIKSNESILKCVIFNKDFNQKSLMYICAYPFHSVFMHIFMHKILFI